MLALETWLDPTERPELTLCPFVGPLLANRETARPSRPQPAPTSGRGCKAQRDSVDAAMWASQWVFRGPRNSTCIRTRNKLALSPFPRRFDKLRFPRRSIWPEAENLETKPSNPKAAAPEAHYSGHLQHSPLLDNLRPAEKLCSLILNGLRASIGKHTHTHTPV